MHGKFDDKTVAVVHFVMVPFVGPVDVDGYKLYEIGLSGFHGGWLVGSSRILL